MQEQHDAGPCADLDLDLLVHDRGATAATRVPVMTGPLPEGSGPLGARTLTSMSVRSRTRMIGNRVGAATAEGGTPAVEDRPRGGDEPLRLLRRPISACVAGEALGARNLDAAPSGPQPIRIGATSPARSWTAVLVLVSTLALGGCVGRLEPAATAQLALGETRAATATIEGVTVVARANAWRGFPSDLDRQLTPIFVTIRNDRAEPVAVKSGEIALVAPNGRRFAALPPRAIEGTLVEPVSALSSTAGGYSGAVGPNWGVFDPWNRSGTSLPRAPFPWDARYDGPEYATIRLPTTDMLARALPDAPIQPGQRVEGFVYVERVGPKGTSVDLVLPLMDADGARSLGEVHIPFVFQ